MVSTYQHEHCVSRLCLQDQGTVRLIGDNLDMTTVGGCEWKAFKGNTSTPSSEWGHFQDKPCVARLGYEAVIEARPIGHPNWSPIGVTHLGGSRVVEVTIGASSHRSDAIDCGATTRDTLRMRSTNNAKSSRNSPFRDRGSRSAGFADTSSTGSLFYHGPQKPFLVARYPEAAPFLVSANL